MGLLDDLLYGSPNGQSMGMLNYSTPDTSASSKKDATAQDLAAALGLNDIGSSFQNNPGMPSAPGITNAPAPGAPGAPSVPISTDNSAPIVAAPAAAPMTSPVAAPQFGANPSPYQFPQSTNAVPQANSGLLFGGNVPPPAVPAPAVPAPMANANAQADDDETPVAPAPGAAASPIGVGGVNMPRVGSAASFVPAQVPAAAPAPVAAPANPISAVGNAAGDRLKASWQSMRNGGGLIGGLSAALTGQRDDPVATAQAAQSATANVTAQALLKAGVDPSLVAAAVQPGNTELLHALFANALTQGGHTQETDKDGNVWDINKQTGQRTIALAAKDDKFQHVVVKNPDGSETLRSFNTKTGEYDAAPAGAALKSAVDPTSTGKERMDQLMAADPNYARKIQSMVDGDMPLPTSGQAARSPQAQRMVEDALAVSDSTSASDFKTKSDTRKDYASGMASRVTKSLNTTIEHAANLDSAIDKLGNHTWFPGVTNWLHDKVGNNTNPEYQKARSQIESAKEAFVKELDFTLSGGHSSVSGSAQLRDNINRADSPEALHAAVQEDLHLLAARLNSHATGFAQGTKSQRDGQDFLYPKNKDTFNRLMGSADTSTGQPVPGVDATAPQATTPAAPAQSGAPAPGAYVWTPGKGLVKQ